MCGFYFVTIWIFHALNKRKIAINKYINFGLKFICKLEDKLSGMLPNWFGGSLFVIGKHFQLFMFVQTLVLECYVADVSF